MAVGGNFGPGFHVSVDPALMARLESELMAIPRGALRAANAAINRTLSTGRSRIVKAIAAEILLPQKDIRETITLQKSTFQTLRGVIRITRKGLPLAKFPGVKQTPKGVAVRVRRRKGREIVYGAFLATMKSGHTGVFRRREAGTKRKLVIKNGKRYWTELPIDEHGGPTVQGVMANAPGVADGVVTDLSDVFERNMLSQIDRLLNRNRADRPE